MADRIQLRRDTKANWERYNPILLEGEPGHVLDEPNLYKMGDGIHNWNDLPYRGYDGTVLQEVQSGVTNAVPSSDAVTKYVGHYIVSPTFLRVYVDADYKLLWAIRKNGDIYFGAGVPSQIVSYINEKISELQLNKVEDIVDFLDGIESGDKTLLQLLNDKVDKAEGKGIIPLQYAKEIKNEDYLKLELDADYRIIGGRKSDGTKFENVALEVGGHIFKNANDGYHMLVLLDEDGRIISCRDKSGKLIENVALEVAGHAFENIEDVHRISVLLDADRRVISYRDKSGKLHENGDVEIKGGLKVLGELKLSSEAISEITQPLLNDYDILSLHPESRIKPLLYSLKYKQMWGSEDTSYDTLTFLHFSDLHEHKESLKRIVKFYNAYSDYIDDVITTGDQLSSTYESSFTFWDECNAGFVLQVLGNHDVWTNGSNGIKGWVESPRVMPGYSQKQCYERFFAPYISNWGVVAVPNKTYWYKDYPNVKCNDYSGGIRMVCIDIYHWNETLKNTNDEDITEYPDGMPVDTGQQATWFTEILEDARINNKAVIVTCHPPYRGITGIECAFHSLGSLDSDRYMSNIAPLVQTFIDNGGKFLFWLCGHTHNNIFGYITDYPNQLTIAAPNAGFNNWSDIPKMTNSINMDAFNILNIEPKKNLIRLHRIGAMERYGREYHSIVYDYKNKRLLV